MNSSETRIALLEGDRMAEIYIERHSKKGLVGNIYKAKVARVLPGMQSAFINIGADRAAFLYGGDVLDPEFVKEEEERRRQEQLSDQEQIPSDMRRHINRTPIEKLLRAGDEICVQVAKEPLGSKGPRVTMLVTVPGRYLVLMPDISSVGISRRIQDEEKRQKLKEEVEAIKPPGMGLIVRTAAEHVPLDVLKADMEYLISEWEQVEGKYHNSVVPSLLYQEPDLILKTTRDLYTDEVTEIVVDNPGAYSQIKHFLADTIPGASDKLKLYTDQNPVFDEFGVEIDISSSLSRRVWLPSGGYIVVDQTEALTSFDVNTGKFVGSQRVQDTILKINLEAVTEVAAQLRKRNIGGIIVIDFIDMENLKDRELLTKTLIEVLKKDKAKTNVLALNELGLVQMTRKRTAESLERVLTVPCPHCEGTGRISSIATSSYELARDIERHYQRTKCSSIAVKVREDILQNIENEEAQLFRDLREKYDLDIQFSATQLNPKLLREPPYEIHTQYDD